MNDRDWIAALTGRGVSLKARGSRLVMKPARAYGEMSDEEHLTLRKYRQEICAIVACEGGEIRGVTPAPALVTPEPPPPAPTKCPYCGEPCLGPDNAAFPILHETDPAFIEQQRQRNTQVMMRQLGKLPN
jgi:hypothetical protein